MTGISDRVQMGQDHIRVRIARGIRARLKIRLALSLLPSATMSRRPSAEAHSSEEDTTASSLSPPRPFFLAGSSDHGHSGDHSDSDSSNNNSPRTSVVGPRKQRNHHRRRSALGASHFSADSEDGHGSRPPPSAFAFPFQAYPGNPDPIPGRTSRRSSIDSVRMVSRSAATNTGPRFPRRPEPDTLPQPKPPFHSKNSPYRSSTGSLSSSAIYRLSAAAAMADGTGAQIPRASSATTIFRGPFLSPASRPASIWTPPNLPFSLGSRTGSASNLPLPPFPVQKKTIPSTRLKEKLALQDKPWLAQKKSSLDKWITFGAILIGLAIAAFIAFRGYTTVRMLTPNQLCLVLDEAFNGGDLDSGTWSVDVELGGYG